MENRYKAFVQGRGNKLYEGSRMILPEHRNYMIEKELHNERFVKRPLLDEDKLQQMSIVLSEAILNSRVVTLRVYGQYGAKSVTVLPQGIDRTSRTLKGLSALGERQVKVTLDDILDVDLEEIP